MEVQILRTKMIKPSAPTPPHLRTLKLCQLDQANPAKLASLLYYSAQSGSGGGGDDGREVERRINRLEASLSETLTRFYPLAGIYIKDGNWVDCNDGGVELFVARVKGRLSVVLSRKNEIINQLAGLAGGEFTPPVASVQISSFDCGGMVIGIRLSHHLVDAFSAISFITSWATATRQGMDGVISPVFGRRSILRSEHDLLPKMKPTSYLTGHERNEMTRLVFREGIISAVRGRAHDPSFPREATRVEVVTALIWRAHMRMCRAKHGRLRSSLAVHTMNMRPRIVPPLPPCSFGNVLGRAVTRFVADSSKTEQEVPELKELVGLLMDSLTRSKETKVRQEDVLPSFVRITNWLHDAEEGGETDVCAFTSWCRFPFYAADFGWGKPVWLSRTPLFHRNTTFMDTEDGDGIEAWVSLTKQDMSLFLQDEDISAFTKEEPILGKKCEPHQVTTRT